MGNSHTCPERIILDVMPTAASLIRQFSVYCAGWKTHSTLCTVWHCQGLREPPSLSSHPARQLLHSVNDFAAAVHDFKTSAFTRVLGRVILRHALGNSPSDTHDLHVETPGNLDHGTRTSQHSKAYPGNTSLKNKFTLSPGRPSLAV